MLKLGLKPRHELLRLILLATLVLLEAVAVLSVVLQTAFVPLGAGYATAISIAVFVLPTVVGLLSRRFEAAIVLAVLPFWTTVLIYVGSMSASTRRSTTPISSSSARSPGPWRAPASCWQGLVCWAGSSAALRWPAGRPRSRPGSGAALQLHLTCGGETRTRRYVHSWGTCAPLASWPARWRQTSIQCRRNATGSA